MATYAYRKRCCAQ